MSTLDVAPRLLGKFVVPLDLIGGTPVGELSGIGRDRRSGRHTKISGHGSRRAPARSFHEAAIDLRVTGREPERLTSRGPEEITSRQRVERSSRSERLTSREPARLASGRPAEITSHRPARFTSRSERLTSRSERLTNWSERLTSRSESLTNWSERFTSHRPAILAAHRPERLTMRWPEQGGLDEICADPRTGDLRWAHDGPGCDPIVIDPFTGDGPVCTFDDDAEPDHTGQPPEDPHSTFLLRDVAPEHPYVIGFETRECTTKPQLSEGGEAEASGHRLGLDGSRFADVSDVDTLRSVLGAPILTVRLTLLADLADRGVPDPDNFEVMTQGPDLPPGVRTPLLTNDHDLKEELRARAVALAIPPKPL
jgi:hypothetical protein